MINITLSNRTPIATAADHIGTYIALDSTKIEVEPTLYTSSICTCKCEYVEKAFSESGAITDSLKNDKTSMIFTKKIASDTIDIYLCYGTTRTQITDSTYGTLYCLLESNLV